MSEQCHICGIDVPPETDIIGDDVTKCGDCGKVTCYKHGFLCGGSPICDVCAKETFTGPADEFDEYMKQVKG